VRARYCALQTQASKLNLEAQRVQRFRGGACHPLRVHCCNVISSLARRLQSMQCCILPLIAARLASSVGITNLLTLNLRPCEHRLDA